MIASTLDTVPGLGDIRRKALLRHFGSLKRLGQATPEEIAEVPGIGRRTAEAVLAALNPPSAAPAATEPPETGAIPPGGAGRTKAGANRNQAGLPAPAPVKTSTVRAALVEADTGSDVRHPGAPASA
jgi:excinuclease ABC subunit C